MDLTNCDSDREKDATCEDETSSDSYEHDENDADDEKENENAYVEETEEDVQDDDYDDYDYEETLIMPSNVGLLEGMTIMRPFIDDITRDVIEEIKPRLFQIVKDAITNGEYLSEDECEEMIEENLEDVLKDTLDKSADEDEEKETQKEDNVKQDENPNGSPSNEVIDDVKQKPNETVVKEPKLVSENGQLRRKYICPRCGEYDTDFTTALKRHFNAKNKCQPTLNDIVLTGDLYQRVIKRELYAYNAKNNHIVV